MKSFKHILVGIDYSTASRKALRQAGRIAREENSKLIAFHAVTLSDIASYQQFGTDSRGTILNRLRSGIEATVKEELGSREAAECEVSVGTPHDELIRHAEDTACDLIVLGSRGSSSDLGEVGTFAARCARCASVPVLLTRENLEEEFNCIVACVDFSKATQEVIETAAKLAVDEKSELHIVHSVYPPWMRPTHILYNLQTAEDEDFRAYYRELLRDQLDAAIRAASQFLPIEINRHILEHPNPNHSLVSFLKDHHADLAVVGRRGGTSQDLKHYLLGSTAERLIHQCPCSVLTVPCKSHD